MDDFLTREGYMLMVALTAMAELVKDYSDDKDNPNVSAWLRSGAVGEIHKIEEAAYDKGYNMGRWMESYGG